MKDIQLSRLKYLRIQTISKEDENQDQSLGRL